MELEEGECSPGEKETLLNKIENGEVKNIYSIDKIKEIGERNTACQVESAYIVKKRKLTDNDKQNTDEEPPVKRKKPNIDLRNVADIKRQIEHYFGDENWSRDTFLQGLANEDGFIGIKRICEFKNMQKILVIELK